MSHIESWLLVAGFKTIVKFIRISRSGTNPIEWWLLDSKLFFKKQHWSRFLHVLSEAEAQNLAEAFRILGSLSNTLLLFRDLWIDLMVGPLQRLKTTIPQRWGEIKNDHKKFPSGQGFFGSDLDFRQSLLMQRCSFEATSTVEGSRNESQKSVRNTLEPSSSHHGSVVCRKLLHWTIALWEHISWPHVAKPSRFSAMWEENLREIPWAKHGVVGGPSFDHSNGGVTGDKIPKTWQVPSSSKKNSVQQADHTQQAGHPQIVFYFLYLVLT